MLSFEPDLLPFIILRGWSSLRHSSDGLHCGLPMLFDDSLTVFSSGVVGFWSDSFSSNWGISQQHFVGTQLRGRIGPPIVYEGCNGQPFIPIILSRCRVHSKVLFYPLILALRQPIGLGVEGGANIAVDP